MMRQSLARILAGLMLCAPLSAEQPPVSVPRLQQLDRASQQELYRLQRGPIPLAAPAASAEDLWRESQARQRQRELQVLQERQRREMLLLRQRPGIHAPGGAAARLDAIGRQRDYRLQQQQQLNRFRIDRGSTIP